MDNLTKIEIQDEILQELWKAKDHYSLSCNSDFKELAKKVKEDIKNLDIMDEHGDIEKVCA